MSCREIKRKSNLKKINHVSEIKILSFIRAILRDRTQKLWSEMTSLRKNLNREVALWKKEREEFQHLREQSDALAFEEAAAAARAAAAAYAVESPLSNDLGNK